MVSLLGSSQVDGPAVVGEHPHLKAGGTAFTYASCNLSTTQSCESVDPPCRPFWFTLACLDPVLPAGEVLGCRVAHIAPAADHTYALGEISHPLGCSATGLASARETALGCSPARVSSWAMVVAANASFLRQFS